MASNTEKCTPTWYQFELVEKWPVPKSLNERYVPVISFPALVPRQYALISEGDAFVLSDSEQNGSTGIFVVVSEGREVKLNVGPGGLVPVEVNGRVVEKGSLSAALEDDDQVKLGGRLYAFTSVTTKLGNILSHAKDCLTCRVCNRAFKDPRMLRCGHMVCAACLNKRINAVMDEPVGVLPLGLNRDDILAQTRTIRCGVCQERVSCMEAMRAVHPHGLAQAVEMLTHLTMRGVVRPTCAVCADVRCIVDTRDYEFCERCSLILCPPCAVEGHRDHELRSRTSIVRDMLAYGKRLVPRKVELWKLHKDQKETSYKMSSLWRQTQGQHEIMGKVLRDTIDDCANLLREFENYVTPFAEQNAEFSDRFAAKLDSSTKRINRVDVAVKRMTDAVSESKATIRKLQPENGPVNENNGNNS